jgi:hypothetical protein
MVVLLDLRTPWKEVGLAKKSGFYKYEKRQKELKKQKKKQEKLARKRQRAAERSGEEEPADEERDSGVPEEWSPGEI